MGKNGQEETQEANEEQPVEGGEEEAEEETTEGSEEAEGETSEEEGETPEEYLDLAKIPDSLKTIAKRMQATHTRKMQKLALSQRKADALDDLMENQSFQRFLADLEAGRPYGSGSNSSGKEEPEVEEESSTEGGKVSVGSLMKAITPLMQQEIQRALAPFVKERANLTYQSVRDKFSDFDDFLPEITQLQKANPNLSLERAYKLAKLEAADEGDPTPKTRKATAKEVKKAGAARTLGAGAAKGPNQVTPKTASTLREALKSALAEQGITT